MTGRTAALETLGCKVNQYESSFFLEALKGAGYHIVPFRERADVYIVHSCAVTSKAGFQTRQLLRRARRLNGDAVVVVAGCDAQVESERFANEGLATHVLGSSEKFDLLSRIEAAGSFSHPSLSVGNPRLCDRFDISPVTRMHSGRTRAYMKVQDGCDAFCSYCIVPYARGKSRSLPKDEVRLQMDRFLDCGYEEVVLTGIHLGQWGRDLDPPQDLTALLSFLHEGPLPSRIRLSSLESVEWTEELIKRLHTWPRICPHFHIPLQSGDEEILERMHRPYTPRQYEELVQELHLLFPDAALGADVMVGFPGETELHFRNTFELISRLPLTYLHVFPFSPRPGTAATNFRGRITGSELKRRTQILQGLSTRKKQAFRKRFLGQWVEILVESQVKPGWWQGTSENYLQVRFPAENHILQGSLVKVRLARMTEDGMEGELRRNGC